MELIEAKTLGSNTANVTFTDIPQTYTDLKLVYSARNTATAAGEGYDATISFNGITADRTTRVLRGDGSSVAVNTISDPSDFRLLRSIQPSDYTSSVFSNVEIYLPNYTSSNHKIFSVDTVLENNATATGMGFIAGQWSNTAAITSITLGGFGGNLLSDSTFYLYGISSASQGAKATGGIVYNDGSYFYHVFLASGTFTPTSALTCDYLVVAGGGGGGSNPNAGGGGAGGLRSTVTATGGGGSLETALSLTAQAYTVTVGAGGAGATYPPTATGTSGTNSVFSTITSTGGGGGAGYSTSASVGGSGGGGSYETAAYVGAAATASPVQGYAGGSGPNTGAFPYAAGGGGGAGAVGSGGGNSDGGVGVQITELATPTNTGANNGYYAGGGAGGKGISDLLSSGGLGGGGTAPNAATVNTGGGGAGASGAAGNAGYAGGSGIVIVRYAI